MKNIYILYTKFNLLVINDKRIATKGIKKTNSCTAIWSTHASPESSYLIKREFATNEQFNMRKTYKKYRTKMFYDYNKKQDAKINER